MSRIPAAGLLIAIGLFVLWLAVTGKIKMFLQKIAVVGEDASGASASGSSSATASPTAIPSSTYHATQMTAALTPLTPLITFNTTT